MKTLVFLCATLAVAAAHYEELNKVEVDPVVANPEVMRSYLNCYISPSTCDERTAIFQVHHDEIVNERCARCSPKLKQGIGRFYQVAAVAVPDTWREYRQKFGHENIDALYDAVVAKHPKKRSWRCDSLLCGFQN